MDLQAYALAISRTLFSFLPFTSSSSSLSSAMYSLCFEVVKSTKSPPSPYFDLSRSLGRLATLFIH